MENPDDVMMKEEEEEEEEEEEAIIESVEKETPFVSGPTYCLYQGLWVPRLAIGGVLSFQKHFQALDDDIILASCPKSGTTWLKALSFSIVNRHSVGLSETPLLTCNPHTVVPTLEFDVYEKRLSIVDIDNIPRPRLLSTHVSYNSLPISLKNSNSKIVYIWRNPMDQAVSLFHFISQYVPTLQTQHCQHDFFASFCRGVHSFGPFWDHVLGFWKAKSENPHRIFFLKYEDLKQQDAPLQLKRLAEFLGFPFSEEEEKQGVIEQISKFCSIENMKTLKGNSDGSRLSGAPNSSFFRKGHVGDWVNHLTPSMADDMRKLIQQKFKDSGLNF